MRRTIERFIRASSPEGVLPEGEVRRMAEGIERLIGRAPFLVRPAFHAFFGSRLAGLAPIRTLETLRHGIGPGMSARAAKLLHKGVATLLYATAYSHPLVLESLGLASGRAIDPNDVEPPEFPDIVRTERFRDFAGPREADYIIVGSGPGGAMAAHRLAAAGHDVLVCEKGARHDDSRPLTLAETAERYYGFGGFLSAYGPGPQAVPVLIGEMVGGSAAVNMATSLVPPRRVIESWGYASGELDAHYEAASHLIGVEPALPEIMGLQNALMARGCLRLGLPWELIPRGARNRGGAAVCMTAGREAWKLSPERALLPLAVRNGARVVSECPVARLLAEGGRVTGVLAGHGSARAVFRARKGVILAAGPVGTPMLLLASGLGGEAVGRARFFQANGSVLARMPEEVRSWEGIEQAVICRAWQESGIALEAVSSPPGLVAPYLPGSGGALLDMLRDFGRYAQIGVIADLDRTPFRLRRVRGEPFMTFRIPAADGKLVRFAFGKAAEILFAAGARSVLLPGLDGWTSGPDEAVSRLRAADHEDLGLVTVHLIGTCAMGDDPKTSVVGRDGRVRGVDGLWLADGSVIPTSLGVNPQLTILALSSLIASRLA